jgi:hypothetical protein
LNGNSTIRVQVGPDGDQAVAQVRLHTLAAFADRLGLGDVLSARIRPRGAGPAARSGHDAGADRGVAPRRPHTRTTATILDIDASAARASMPVPPNTRNGRSSDPHESEITLNRRPRAREAGQ